MKFTKMQGLGNDALYVDGEPQNPEELSIRLSERHFGAGSDGMIWISPSEIADFKMRIFNADGSEAKMCGNGIRCVGKYVYDKGYTDRTELTIETLSGIRTLKLEVKDGAVASVTVDMGQAVTEEEMELSLNVGLDAGAEAKRITCMPVSMGNPHAVTFVEDAEAVPLEKLGPAVEKHPEFPGGVNAEFVQVLGENKLRMRVWERGSGVTLACGTGACASAAAAVKKGFCRPGEPVYVQLDGGTLSIRIQPDNTVFMTGPAEFVYEGEVNL